MNENKQYAFDLDTLSLLEGYNGKSKLLIKARILHFFMMNKRGLTVNSVRR